MLSHIKKRHFNLFVTLLVLQVCSMPTSILMSQIGWNEAIDIPNTGSRITSIAVSSDTIILYGTGIATSQETRQGVIFVQLDSNGHILKNRIVLDTSSNDHLSVTENYGKVISDEPDDFVATASVLYRNSVLFLRLNDTLGLEHVREYADTVNLSNFNYTVAPAQPDGFYLYGQIQGPDTVLFGFIRRIDMYGEEIWERRFEHSLYNTTVMDVQQLNSGMAVALSVEQESPPGSPTQSGRSRITLLSPTGEVLNEWVSDLEPEEGYFRQVIPVDSSSFIIYGQRQVPGPIPNYTLLQPTLSRFDTAFQRAWSYSFGTPQRVDAFSTLMEFEKTADGHIVGCGRKLISSFVAHGWMYKFSYDGEEIWDRNFPVPFTDYFPAGGLLFGLGQLSSGNLVAGGIATDEDNKRYGWFVKMTNEGCLDTMFCTPVPTQVPEAAALLAKAYPNPATDHWVVEWGHTDPAHLQLLDLQGRVLLETTIRQGQQEISAVGLPPGVYILSFRGQNVTGSIRVVKQ
jgi:hypothetical protein